MSNSIHNLNYLKDTRQELRNNPTLAEELLWNAVNRKQLDGKKFRRQHSIGCYITDFYCPQEKLAIELDGAYHFTEEQKQLDNERTDYLTELNIRVIRFKNEQVIHDIENVLKEIRAHFR